MHAKFLQIFAHYQYSDTNIRSIFNRSSPTKVARYGIQQSHWCFTYLQVEQY